MALGALLDLAIGCPSDSLPLSSLPSPPSPCPYCLSMYASGLLYLWSPLSGLSFPWVLMWHPSSFQLKLYPSVISLERLALPKFKIPLLSPHAWLFSSSVLFFLVALIAVCSCALFVNCLHSKNVSSRSQGFVLFIPVSPGLGRMPDIDKFWF